jgi:hypothetical protein
MKNFSDYPIVDERGSATFCVFCGLSSQECNVDHYFIWHFYGSGQWTCWHELTWKPNDRPNSYVFGLPKNCLGI